MQNALRGLITWLESLTWLKFLTITSANYVIYILPPLTLLWKVIRYRVADYSLNAQEKYRKFTFKCLKKISHQSFFSIKHVTPLLTLENSGLDRRHLINKGQGWECAREFVGKTGQRSPIPFASQLPDFLDRFLQPKCAARQSTRTRMPPALRSHWALDAREGVCVQHLWDLGWCLYSKFE